jgi:hypothetical protein
MVLDNFGLIIKVEFFCCCPPFWVLSHMKENMLARRTLEAHRYVRRIYFKCKPLGEGREDA